MKIMNAPGNQQVTEMDKGYDVSRRRFFQLAGGIAGAGLLLSSCHKRTPATDLPLGSGDTGLLNFLYILQQLEASFYTQAAATPYINITKSELVLLTDVRDQEIAHKEFLQALLGTNAIAALSFNFSAVTFADRTSVITHAATIEDLVISGFNGAAPLFADKNNVLAISKMITVEGRHSAYFKDIFNYTTFADAVIDANGLDQATDPQTVISSAEAYIITRLDSTQLP